MSSLAPLWASLPNSVMPIRSATRTGSACAAATVARPSVRPSRTAARLISVDAYTGHHRATHLIDGEKPLIDGDLIQQVLAPRPQSEPGREVVSTAQPEPVRRRQRHETEVRSPEPRSGEEVRDIVVARRPHVGAGGLDGEPRHPLTDRKRAGVMRHSRQRLTDCEARLIVRLQRLDYALGLRVRGVGAEAGGKM